MKSFSLLSLALSASHVSASPFAGLHKRQIHPDMLNALATGKMSEYLGGPKATEQLTQMARTMGASETKPGTIGDFVTKTMNVGYGKVARQAGDVPEIEVIPARSKIAGSKSVKIRYGPYTVPSVTKKNMVGEEGSLFNYPDKEVRRPCAGDCTLIGIQAGLEYPDGKNANIDTGMWLHHMAMFTIGEGRQDATCRERDVSLPHVFIGATAKSSERFMASGNERTPFGFGIDTKAGYMLRPSDTFAMAIDLMNENTVDKKVYITMTYDYIEGHPQGWDDVLPVWLDVRQCGTSEVTSPQSKGNFSINYDWTSDVNGEILGAGGHVHDGGIKVTLFQDGKNICDSVASYGAKKEFVAPERHGAHAGIEHISGMTYCGPSSSWKVDLKAGQKWKLDAAYDFDKYKPSMHASGGLDKIMGIALMYVRKTKA